MIRIAMTRYEHRGLIACVCTTSGLTRSFECNVAVLFCCVDAACGGLQQQRWWGWGATFATDWCLRLKRTARANQTAALKRLVCFRLLNHEIFFVPWRLLVSAASFVVARMLCIFSIFSPFYMFSIVLRWCNTRRSIAEMHVRICGLDEIVLLLLSMLITWNVISCVWICGLWPW